jgi:cellulose synthase/poly-beta-1,6-N-acetylglucosamine synthase-like glycosyltransferase
MSQDLLISKVHMAQKSAAYFSQRVTDWKKVVHKIDATPMKRSVNNEKDPLVSVVLVHRNRHLLLQDAIASIEKQTYKNFEIVLVDDGSTDPEAIAYLNSLAWTWWEKKGWRVVREPNRYLGAARNTGGDTSLQIP